MKKVVAIITRSESGRFEFSQKAELRKGETTTVFECAAGIVVVTCKIKSAEDELLIREMIEAVMDG